MRTIQQLQDNITALKNELAYQNRLKEAGVFGAVGMYRALEASLEYHEGLLMERQAEADALRIEYISMQFIG